MQSDDLFQDELVWSVDLNQMAGQILDKASKHPVTITRDEESFALIRREVAANWRKEASHAIQITEILWSAFAAGASLLPELEWISAFDNEERQQLGAELMDAYRKAIRDGTWEELEATIHEWSESGWAALSPELRSAFAEVRR